MKLSEKGLKRLIRNCVSVIPSPYSCGDGDDEPSYHLIVKKQWYHNRNQCSIKKFDFKPEDFQGCICLSIEEAKEIEFKLKELSEGYFLSTGNIDSRSVEWSIVLNERIEQAKGYIPINNASFMEGKLILPEQTENE